MIDENLKAILKTNIILIEKSKTTLEQSYDRCSKPDFNKKTMSDYSVEDQEKLETLSNRFSRISDLLLQKLFWTIDRIEHGQSANTLIDSLNNAIKRGIIDENNNLWKFWETRNELSHGYIDSDI